MFAAELASTGRRTSPAMTCLARLVAAYEQAVTAAALAAGRA